MFGRNVVDTKRASDGGAYALRYGRWERVPDLEVDSGLTTTEFPTHDT